MASTEKNIVEKKLPIQVGSISDFIVTNPLMDEAGIAKHCNVSKVWLSRMMNSDAFRGALSQRKAELVDPFMQASIEEKLKGIVSQSLDVVAQRLELTNDPNMALRALETAGKLLTAANKQQGPVVNHSFVVQMPNVVADPTEWAMAYAPKAPTVGEATPLSFEESEEIVDE